MAAGDVDAASDHSKRFCGKCLTRLEGRISALQAVFEGPFLTARDSPGWLSLTCLQAKNRGPKPLPRAGKRLQIRLTRWGKESDRGPTRLLTQKQRWLWRRSHGNALIQGLWLVGLGFSPFTGMAVATTLPMSLNRRDRRAPKAV